MPEGPSLVYIKNEIAHFAGRKVTAAGGYTQMETGWLVGKKLLEVKTWGKHLLLRFNNGTVRIHLMLFGSLLVNKTKKVNASFYVHFGKDQLNFYVAKAQKIDGPLEKTYDWRTDILSPEWNQAPVLKLLDDNGDATIGDLLMDQQVFTGVGNIIRIEVLFRAKLHPLCLVKNIPLKDRKVLLKEVRKYAKEFLREKNAGTFGSNWQVYQQEECPRDGAVIKVAMLGKTKRKTYYCSNCQVLHSPRKKGSKHTIPAKD
ncbi:MAG: DNA-formamidopyrimidine glycosylase family protein [Bacteroidota bacterium]